jgi:hypothetical protein
MVTHMVTDYDQDGHVVGAHEEPVNSDSKDKPVPARRVDRLLATGSLPAPAPPTPPDMRARIRRFVKPSD